MILVGNADSSAYMAAGNRFMNAFAKLVVLAIYVLLCSLLGPLAFGDDSAAVKSDMQKYEVQLNVTLHTRLDAEKAYVHEVIELVRLGRLPRKLVDKAVFWVRNHVAYDNYGFVYFERVLRRQAQQLKFPVPAFNYDVYDTSNR